MLRREIAFLAALWKANLQAAMEYRAAFLAQVVGMMLNNAVYFAIWVVFFDRFGEVRGWGIDDMVLLYAVVAVGFGLAAVLFGNAMTLADIVAGGGLDYYLALPRPVLLHLLANRSRYGGLGDVCYGLLTFGYFARGDLGALGRFALGATLSMVVFLAFMVLVQSLVFWMGSASQLGAQSTNALLTFALYPISLFDGTAKFVLFTILPAAFVGSVPAALVRAVTWPVLAQAAAAAAVLLALALAVFHRGLRRYESGSAVQVQV